MNEPAGRDVSPDGPKNRRLALAEMVLVFAVFFVQGASPVPDVNEPYYLSKAIHYWNPGWGPGDFFLESPDTHEVFFFTFGWLSIWLAPPVLAWVGRLLTWALLAWSWRRLSFALVPRRWFSILTASVFVMLLDRCHMAGEWVVGGVEAKGFAYVLVFLGLEALVRDRWNRTWLLLGAASAFHVLVGGWSVVAAGLTWLFSRGERPPLRSMGPALLGGFLLSLFGLIPALRLTGGVDSQTVRSANEIYVFARLAHHLDVLAIRPAFVIRFLALTLALVILQRVTPSDQQSRRLWKFVLGAILIAAAGATINLLLQHNRPLAAGLLRFYWYRLSDVAVPVGVALIGGHCVARLLQSRPRVGGAVLAVTIVMAGCHVGGYTLARLSPARPPAVEMRDYDAWRRTCRWVVESGNVAPDARFLTPRLTHTFTWYTGRSQVITWKDVPQDPVSINQWYEALVDIYGTGIVDRPSDFWHVSLAQALTERDGAGLTRLVTDYGVDYVLTVHRPRLALPVVHEDGPYVIYRLSAEIED